MVQLGTYVAVELESLLEGMYVVAMLGNLLEGKYAVAELGNYVEGRYAVAELGSLLEGKYVVAGLGNCAEGRYVVAELGRLARWLLELTRQQLVPELDHIVDWERHSMVGWVVGKRLVGWVLLGSQSWGLAESWVLLGLVGMLERQGPAVLLEQ